MATHPSMTILAFTNHISFFNLVNKLNLISFLGIDSHSEEHPWFSRHLYSFMKISPNCREGAQKGSLTWRDSVHLFDKIY